MSHHAVDAQPVPGAQLSLSSLSGVLASNQLLQRLDSLVQRSLLGRVDLKLGLVIRHHTVSTGPLTAKVEEQR